MNANELNMAAVAVIRAALDMGESMAGARALVETTSLEATLLEDPMLLLNAVAAIAANALQGSSRMSAALGNPTTAHQILDEFEAGLRALWEADDDDS